MNGKTILDYIIKHDLLRSHCKDVTVWKKCAEDKLDKFLKEWSITRKLDALKKGESIVIMGDDYGKTMKEIGCKQTKGFLSKDFVLKKAQVIVGDELKIGCYVEKI